MKAKESLSPKIMIFVDTDSREMYLLSARNLDELSGREVWGLFFCQITFQVYVAIYSLQSQAPIAKTLSADKV